MKVISVMATSSSLFALFNITGLQLLKFYKTLAKFFLEVFECIALVKKKTD